MVVFKCSTNMKIFSQQPMVLVLSSVLGFMARSSPAANPAGVGPEAARASVKSLAVAEGLQVSLFASEPMVLNPTDMDVDARGRVWITEGANYRSSVQKW